MDYVRFHHLTTAMVLWLWRRICWYDTITRPTSSVWRSGCTGTGRADDPAISRRRRQPSARNMYHVLTWATILTSTCSTSRQPVTDSFRSASRSIHRSLTLLFGRRERHRVCRKSHFRWRHVWGAPRQACLPMQHSSSPKNHHCWQLKSSQVARLSKCRW